jgi:regulator of sigma E protease
MLLTIIVFIIVLGLLVFVHELGHFVTARKFGVKAEEFGFGFPPRICGWRKVNGKRKFFWGNEMAEKIESEDTILSLNWLPIGGFVKIKGEDGDSKDADSFATRKAWKRTVILSAGVLMNFFLAMVLLSAAYMMGSPQVVDGQEAGGAVSGTQVQILQVMPESPAEEAGLVTGDVIMFLDDQQIEDTDDVQNYLADKQDTEVLVVINHFGEQQEKTVIPKYDEADQAAEIGVSIIKSGIVAYPWYQAIWMGIKNTVLLTGQIIVGFYTLIKGLFVGMPAGIDIAGPVGIAVMTGQVARLGFVYLLQFSALLSINLAIINFIPFPGLDGGRVMFIIIEKIKRKPVDRKFEQIVHTVGFFLLIFLVIIITGRDIGKYKDVFVNLFHRIVG